MVKLHVDKSATVFTDSLNAYKGLDKHFSRHEIVNHDQDEYVRGIVYTNRVEGFFSILKRGIYGIYHQVSAKHLHRYCDEFSARYNTREIKDNERFELAVKNSEGRLKYNDLTQKL
ncbi:MAG: family transposase [Chitinophagaceae bacterium]|nr:family transposase [Chitinophagaceae bacterium]